MLENTIARLRTEIDGQLSSRSRIIDGLLDLRLEANGETSIILAVDALLVDIPGLSTVSTDWWTEQLDSLELLSVTVDGSSDRELASN